MQQNAINCTHNEGAFRFFHIYHVVKCEINPHVEKSEISFNLCIIYGSLLHFTLFCCKKFCFFAIYAVFRKIGLLQFTLYCVEKVLATISDRGEKITNMRYIQVFIPVFPGGRRLQLYPWWNFQAVS